MILLRPAFGSRILQGLRAGCGLVWLAAAACGAAAEASGPALPGADLFTNGSIPRLRLQLSAQDLESLRRQARQFVPATLFEGTNVYPDVAVHLKGSLGSFRPLDDKPALTLDFCRLDQGRRFHGLRRIHLNNSVEDPSYTNEKLGSELFRAAGVPAPRVTRALVVLNGRPLGLYVLKEGFTEDFLACHFKRVCGDLFEPENGHDINQRLKRNSLPAPAGGRAALKALAEAALEPDPARRWARLEQTLDTQRFLAFMAMEVMLGHRDGYCLARNNFRVYHDLDSGKMVFLPHGMDQLLGSAQLPWRPFLSGLVARAVMETPEGKARYETCFRTLFTNLFRTELLAQRVEQLALELRPCLAGADFEALQKEALQVKDRIAQRQRDLETQLGRPELKLMELHGGVGRLSGWVAADAPEGGRMDRAQGPGSVPALHIVAGPRTSASWRTTALLERGSYRFEGRATVGGVKPLPSGLHQGAGLRIGGGLRQAGNMVGDSSWQLLGARFQVERPVQEIEFICELRASSGQAWFDLDSLRVVRLPD